MTGSSTSAILSGNMKKIDRKITLPFKSVSLKLSAVIKNAQFKLIHEFAASFLRRFMI
jgi:hypothetical protein